MRRTASLPSIMKPEKKGLKKANVRKPNPMQDISEDDPATPMGPAPKNTGGGLPFFNPYGGATSKPKVPKPKVAKPPKPKTIPKGF